MARILHIKNGAPARNDRPYSVCGKLAERITIGGRSTAGFHIVFPKPAEGRRATIRYAKVDPAFIDENYPALLIDHDNVLGNRIDKRFVKPY